MLMPRQPVPALQVPTLAHGAFSLADDAARHFTLVVSTAACTAPSARSTCSSWADCCPSSTGAA